MTKHTVPAAAIGLPISFPDVITVPAERIAPVDLMDRGLDAIRTVHVALFATDMVDDEALLFMAATVERALSDLSVVRGLLNRPAAAPTASLDAELLGAWERYKTAYRALQALPVGSSEEAERAIYAVMTPNEDVLVEMPARTLKGLLVKLKFMYHKTNDSGSAATAMFDDVDLREADREEWVDRMGWHIIQNIRSMVEA